MVNILRRERAQLYIIFINELLDRIRQTRQGCHYKGVSAAALAYADDLALIGLAQQYDKNGLHLQGLLDTCGAFAKEQMFHFGFKKQKS